MTKIIVIHNDGQEIAETNYFETEMAQRGLCYLSWNAGAGRLLLPPALENTVGDMRTAQYIIISIGPWAAARGETGIELLFEDNSDSPFCLHIQQEGQSDRHIPSEDDGSDAPITVWTQAGKVLALPGKIRFVPKIPYLQPWG